VTYLWFYPEKPGEHVITCTEYCGIGHSYMAGKVIVLPAEEFASWYQQEATRFAQENNKAAKPEA
jgi:cytochrome c oxidase subunit 2